MKTVQASIRLNDAVTRPLKNMQRAMSVIISQFENMQRAAGKNVKIGLDMTALQNAKAYISNAAAEIGNAERKTKQAARAQREYNQKIKHGGDAATLLANKVAGAVAAYTGLHAAKGIITLADNMTTTKARLDLMNDGSQTTQELQDKIMASAQASRASYLETADAVSKMGIMASDAFSSNDELIQFSELINKQFAIAGTTTGGQAAAMLQLTQAMGSGVLRGEELNSVFEQAPTIIQSIADYMGEPIGRIRELARDGQITATTVKNAMLAGADTINERFNSMPMTFGQIWTNAKNAMLSAFAPAINFIGRSAQWICDNWGMIEPIFYPLVAAVGAFIAVLLVWKAVTIAQTIAQWALNAGLLACPLTWIAVGIAAVIGLIIWWVKSCGGLRVAWLILCQWITHQIYS